MEVNDAIMAHEMAEDWDYKELTATLKRVSKAFNEQHFLEMELPTVQLRFERTNRKARARYRPGKNAIGANFEITLNVKHFHRPLLETIGDFVHMLIHQYEEIAEIAGKNNFHTVKFVKAAERIGIPCDGGTRCNIIEYRPEFRSWLAELGIVVDAQTLATARPEDAVATSTLKAWLCDCGPIRAGREIRMRCEICGKLCVRADSGAAASEVALDDAA